MSLQVWLPLNEDLHNQGLCNFVITNNGATIDNNGKIGKCYAFNTVGNYIQTNYNFYPGTNDFSIACWFYLTENTNQTYQHICSFKTTAAASAGVAMIYHRGQQKFLWSTADGSTAQEIWSADSFPTSTIYNTWHHLIMIRDNDDNRHGYFYLDGVRKELASIPTILNITTNANQMRIGSCGASYNPYYWTGKLNDFRLYDHALSKKEAEEIAKGLVLHYKLDSNGQGNPNLIPNTSPNEVQYTYPSGNTYNDKFSATTSIVPSASQYILSFDAKSTVAGDKVRAHYYNPNTTTRCETNQGVITTATDGNIDFTLSTQWEHYWVIYTQSSTTAVKRIIFPRMFGPDRTEAAKGSGIVSVRNLKFEEGTVSTMWQPNSNDSLYISFNFNNTIYDSSGYNNDGEIINTITIDTDSPRYKAYTHFSATNQKIKISGLSTTGFSNSYTFTWWEKISSVNPMHWGFSDGVRLNGMYTGRLWNTGDGSNNPLYNPGTTTQVTAPSINVWHHWAMVGNGTKCLVYQDGELWAEAKTYKTITGTTIFINGWNANTDYSSDNASISDFRLYSTALTADQIKELYNTSATIDNKGNIHTRELVET